MRGAAELVTTPIDVAGVLARLDDPATGALATFLGRVRNVHQGEPVDYLEYTADESFARAQMDRILHLAAARWDLRAAALVHRLGRLEIGELSVLAAAACPHRADSFDACRFLIESLKAEVPIWKKEFAPSGAARWIGAE